MTSKFSIAAAFVLTLIISALSVTAQPTDAQARASALWKQGVADFQAQRYDAAITSFNEYIKLRPDAASAWYNRGVSYYEKAKNAPLESDFRKAVADLSEAIKRDGKQKDYWLMRGRLYQRLIVIEMKNNSAAAIADYTQAILLDGKYAEAWSGRGQVQYEIGNYDKALNDLNTAILFNKNDAVPYFYRGRIMGYQNRYAASRSDIEKAISLFPNYEAAKIYLDYINKEERKATAAATKPVVAKKPPVVSKKPVATKPPAQKPPTTGKLPAASAVVPVSITTADQGFKLADDAEKARDHRKVIDLVTKTLPLIPMQSEGLPVKDLDEFAYLDLLKKRAKAYLALKLYKEAQEEYGRVVLHSIKNMNRHNAKANEEFRKDMGSGGGAIMATVQTASSTIICRSTFTATSDWVDTLDRERADDLAMRLTSTILLASIREACAVAYTMEGGFEEAKGYGYFGSSITTKQLNAAIERYTTAIQYLKLYRDAYVARGKAYRALGRNDLALADEQKAASIPVRK